MTAPTQGYRRLALATVAATFLLIVLGSVVRVSDSGLGCGKAHSGLHGWPLCQGDLIPGVSLHSIVEYAHRTVASLVALLLIALAVLAWRRHREHRGIVRASIAAAVLVLAQGLLGAATVDQNLNETLVATHLGLAMILLTLALYIWRASRPDVIGAPAVDGGPRFRPLALVSQIVLFCTIVAGGYMAGTQHYGRPDYQLGDGAHHACGKEFPACNGSFLPFGKSRLVDIQLAHRVLMYVLTVLLVALVALALRRRAGRSLGHLARVTIGLLVVQILLGALNVWLDEYETLIVAHLTVATLLWATVSGITLQLFGVPTPETSGAAQPARTKAVTA